MSGATNPQWLSLPLLPSRSGAAPPRSSTVVHDSRTAYSSAARHSAAAVVSRSASTPPSTANPLEASIRPNTGECTSVSGSQPAIGPPFSASSPRARCPVPRSTARSHAGRWNRLPPMRGDEALDPRRLVGLAQVRRADPLGREGERRVHAIASTIASASARAASRCASRSIRPHANSCTSWRSLGAICSRLV